MAEHVGKQLGYYQLLRLLGRGGFASVYLGEHIHLKSLAAVKVLYTRLAEDLQENFLKEARILAHCSHPGIVRILDFGIDEGVPFLVMEYAPYGTLRQLHPHNVKLPLVMVMNYVNQIADGLQYAHDQKLIHRDLKPDNVLVGQRGNLLLSDFGVALMAQSTGGRDPEVSFAGTAAYMAPEQLRGMPQLVSDQYALGVMVYEWLCGKRPFQGNVVELYSQHSAVPPRPLREHVPDLPVEVEQIVLKALSKDPDERFPSVKAFAMELEQACQVMQRMAVVGPAIQSAPLHNDDVAPAMRLDDTLSTDPQTSHPSEAITPETSAQQPAPSTSSAAPVLPTTPHTEPSTSQAPLPAGQASVSPSEQVMTARAHISMVQSGQLQNLSEQPADGKSAQTSTPAAAQQPLPETAEIGHRRKGRARKAVLLLAVPVLLVILMVGSATLSAFSQERQGASGGITPTRTTLLGLRGTATPAGVTGTPEVSRTATSSTPLSDGSSSADSGSLPAAGKSLSIGISTPTVQAQPASVPTTATSLPVSTATPTPTVAVQRDCTTYGWSMSAATGSQSGSFTTSANCSTVKATLSRGLLTITHIIIQACTTSGCGSAQVALSGSTVTLLTNVAPGTSFYLKTTSVLALDSALSGTVAC
jgi:serine/threonine protein kinase